MAAQATATDQFIGVNGLRLHYLDWGNVGAPPLVLLHGLRGSARAWDGVASELCADYHVLALDQRGRGDSDWAPDGDYTRAAYVSDLEQVVDQLGLDHFVLIGHSMGGANTFVYAARHPDRVAVAVVEDMGPTATPPAPGLARIGRELDATPSRFDSWAAAEAFTRQLRPGASDETISSVACSSLKELHDGTITWKYDLEGIRRARLSGGGGILDDLWPHVRGLRCPTLVLRGARSDIFAAETAQAMAEANPHLQWVEIPDASHFVHDDNLPAFNREVTRFLRGTRQ